LNAACAPTLSPFRTVGRWLVVLLLATGFAGCQLLQPTEEDEPVEDPPIIEEVTEPEPDVTDGTLNDAIHLLQEGRSDPAREILENILAERPAHRMAARLLEQITEPPEQILGTEYREYRVRPGDSLSGLAARYLDDALLFYALARYNEIEQPGLISEGQVIRIPVGIDEDKPVAEPLVTDDTDVVATARVLGENERYNEAVSLLVAAARGGNLDEGGRKVMLDFGLSLADAYLDAGHLDRSESVIDRILPWTQDLPDADERVAGQQRRIDARVDYQRAREALEEDDYDRAHEYLLSAIDRDPDFSEAADRESGLRADRVERHHERALRAYRDQDLNEAIESWSRVLEMEPEFEPARIYRDRALELQRRLDES